MGKMNFATLIKRYNFFIDDVIAAPKNLKSDLKFEFRIMFFLLIVRTSELAERKQLCGFVIIQQRLFRFRAPIWKYLHFQFLSIWIFFTKFGLTFFTLWIILVQLLIIVDTRNVLIVYPYRLHKSSDGVTNHFFMSKFDILKFWLFYLHV